MSRVPAEYLFLETEDIPCLLDLPMHQLYQRTNSAHIHLPGMCNWVLPRRKNCGVILVRVKYALTFVQKRMKRKCPYYSNGVHHR